MKKQVGRDVNGVIKVTSRIKFFTLVQIVVKSHEKARPKDNCFIPWHLSLSPSAGLQWWEHPKLGTALTSTW